MSKSKPLSVMKPLKMWAVVDSSFQIVSMRTTRDDAAWQVILRRPYGSECKIVRVLVTEIKPKRKVKR